MKTIPHLTATFFVVCIGVLFAASCKPIGIVEGPVSPDESGTPSDMHTISATNIIAANASDSTTLAKVASVKLLLYKAQNKIDTLANATYSNGFTLPLPDMQSSQLMRMQDYWTWTKNLDFSTQGIVSNTWFAEWALVDYVAGYDGDGNLIGKFYLRSSQKQNNICKAQFLFTNSEVFIYGAAMTVPDINNRYNSYTFSSTTKRGDFLLLQGWNTLYTLTTTHTHTNPSSVTFEYKYYSTLDYVEPTVLVADDIRWYFEAD
jgi:hypothetical protein